MKNIRSKIRKRDKLVSRWNRPYEIVELSSKEIYKIKNEKGDIF